jgi:nicotinic acid phosphoribosyltransferase
LKAYREQKADLVVVDTSDDWWADRRLVAADLLDTTGGVVRHDSRKLAALIEGIAEDLSRRDGKTS